MFLLHIAFSLALIVILGSAFLIAWVGPNKEKLAQNIAMITLVLSLINMACISFYGICYWKEGYYRTPSPIMSMMRTEKMTSSETTQP